MPETTPADRLSSGGNAATRGCLLITACTDADHHAALAALLEPGALYVLGTADVASVSGVQVRALPLDGLAPSAWPDAPLGQLPDGPAARVIDLTAGPPALRLALVEHARPQDLRCVLDDGVVHLRPVTPSPADADADAAESVEATAAIGLPAAIRTCLLYTSPSPRDQRGSRMPSSA